MSRKAKRGFKAPKNYDPNRGKKSNRRGQREHKQQRDAAAGSARRRGGYEHDLQRGELGSRDWYLLDSSSDSRRAKDGNKRGSGAKRERENQHDYSAKRGSGKVRARGNARDLRFDSAGAVAREVKKPRRQDALSNEQRGNKQVKSGYQPPADVVLERLQAKQTTSADVAGLSFADLGLGERICASLAQMGAVAPFAIQAATIPDVLAGKDVLGRGRTGSGKTIAFGAALVERLLQLKAEGLFAGDPVKPKRERGKRREFVQGRAPKALIMAPTRELALQIDRTVQPLAKAVGFYTTQVVGGAPIARQQHALRLGVDIVIGTPGRVEDLIERGDLDIRKVAIAVLDEADHMAELGFLEPVQRIWRGVAPGAQRLLFSATLDAQVAKLVSEFLPNPAVHEVAEQAAGVVAHHALVVLREEKMQLLTEILRAAHGSVIVFTRTRSYAEMLRELCADAGIAAVDLHGNLAQAKRERNLRRFADGKARVLVATDVAARGIHVDNVELVVQADAPDDYKSYLHRAGRTGRAGSNGLVVTLVPRNRQKRTRELLRNAEVNPAYFGDLHPGERFPWELN